jgi:biliverdin reductase
MTNYSIKAPIKVGLVGTGYAAKKRAEAFIASPYAELIAFTGNTPENCQNFAQTYQIPFVDSWQKLVNDPNIDLICISNFNRDHSLIAYAALKGKKHVIIEYPLALTPQEGENLLKLAQTQEKLLHVEHIELLGGVHQAIRQYLPKIGDPTFATYTTITPKNPAPHVWNYHYHYYGFPFVAALSRIHRFTDLFGSVSMVNCQARFWDSSETGYFRSCLSNAQLSFTNGLIVNLTYGKGENFSTGERTLVIYGNKGTLIFEGEKGKLIQGENSQEIEVGSRRGLFAKDTNFVLEYLLENKPLYVENTASLYALQVAYSAFISSKNGVTEYVE